MAEKPFINWSDVDGDSTSAGGVDWKNAPESVFEVEIIEHSRNDNQNHRFNTKVIKSDYENMRLSVTLGKDFSKSLIASKWKALFDSTGTDMKKLQALFKDANTPEATAEVVATVAPKMVGKKAFVWFRPKQEGEEYNVQTFLSKKAAEIKRQEIAARSNAPVGATATGVQTAAPAKANGAQQAAAPQPAATPSAADAEALDL